MPREIRDAENTETGGQPPRWNEAGQTGEVEPSATVVTFLEQPRADGKTGS